MDELKTNIDVIYGAWELHEEEEIGIDDRPVGEPKNP
jgi:hypothetical protein